MPPEKIIYGKIYDNLKDANNRIRELEVILDITIQILQLQLEIKKEEGGLCKKKL